jgi:hypothetical protein
MSEFMANNYFFRKVQINESEHKTLQSGVV